MFAKSLAAAAILSMASAQSGVEVIPVLVGMSANGSAGQIFSPEKVTAPVGSMVQFQFMGGNHTVTQSTFADPCTPLSTSNSSATGFHSDYVPAENNAESGQVPTYTIMVNDTNPIWAYCAQGEHCKNGMVMVINENAESENTLDAYKTAAASVEQATVPDANTANGSAGGDNGGGDGGDNGGDAQGGQDAAGVSLRVPAALLAIAAGAAALF